MSLRGRCHPHAAAVRSGSLEPGTAPPPLGTVQSRRQEANLLDLSASLSASSYFDPFRLFQLTTWDTFPILQVFQD